MFNGYPIKKTTDCCCFVVLTIYHMGTGSSLAPGKDIFGLFIPSIKPLDSITIEVGILRDFNDFPIKKNNDSWRFIVMTIYIICLQADLWPLVWQSLPSIACLSPELHYYGQQINRTNSLTGFPLEMNSAGCLAWVEGVNWEAASIRARFRLTSRAPIP